MANSDESSLSSPSPRSMKMQLKAYLGLSTYRNMMHMTQEVIHEVTTGLYPLTNSIRDVYIEIV